ncbi:unnamed protein product [Closterium sp. Yama58-4]|nr:unnamed protein product [Closterium sp. Yama58-4]
MLQYFRLVEGCIPLIRAYERRHAFTFDWLLRTRVDTFWHCPLPPLAAFPLHAYTIPFGSDCFGLNDRFGLGTWGTALPALSRLSMLSAIAAGGKFRRFSMQGVGGLGQEASNPQAIPVEVPTGLNSEQAFKAQLALAGVPVARADLSFCVVSRRVYRHHAMPVLSLNASTPLNGAKCRPCYPKMEGAQANLRIRRWYLEGSRFGPHHSPAFINRTAFALCDAAKPWPAPHLAAALFDAAAGPRLARERRSIMHVTLQGCAKNFRKSPHRMGFLVCVRLCSAWPACPVPPLIRLSLLSDWPPQLRRHAEEWQAPAEAVLCFRSQLGEVHLLGPPGQCFYTALQGVNRTRCVSLTRSLLAAFTRSLLAALTRSLLAAFTRSLLAAFTRSLLAAFTHTLLAAFTRSLLTAFTCSLLAALTRSPPPHAALTVANSHSQPLWCSSLVPACLSRHVPASVVMTTTPRAAHAKGSWEWSMRRHSPGLHVTALPAGPAHASSPTAHTLKLSLTGADLPLIFDWHKQNASLPTCQLLLAFPDAVPPPDRNATITALHQLGFHLMACIQEPRVTVERCSFFSLKYCSQLLGIGPKARVVRQ